MAKEEQKKLLRILILTLLLSIIGTAMLGGLTSGAEDNSTLQDSQPSCYTIDTSRPEWLGGWSVAYLPVIVKGYSP